MKLNDLVVFYSRMPHKPSFLFLSPHEWDERIREADRIATSCGLCPRRCGVNRMKGEKGFCKAPGELVISSIFPHHGEEPPISGKNGSGTVFFSYCTLKCLFCQNYQISHEAEGETFSPLQLAQKLIGLERLGCHNINLVTPAHFLPWILRALKEAAGLGLSIPLVYNNGGYESPEALGLLRGVVDIYLPDMKYGNPEAARKYSCAGDYVEVNRAAIIEMFRQAGPLRIDKNEIACRGLCIRHLVLPNGRAHSEDIVKFLVSSFDPQDLTISLMAQYRPIYRAHEFPELSRRVTLEEYDSIKRLIEHADINGYFQELERMDGSFCIDFKSRKKEPLTGR
jgi:putative pyruvate formate lyase activating enzyme